MSRDRLPGSRSTRVTTTRSASGATLIGALRTVVPAFGDEALARLPSAGPSLVDVVLPPLINELAGSSQRSVLVLDDYHLVHNELIHTSVRYLLRHLPRTLQLAIASRADPPLQLAGLRASGEVTEIRAEELRFSDEEADALLNGSLDLGLERSDLDLLQARDRGLGRRAPARGPVAAGA